MKTLILLLLLMLGCIPIPAQQDVYINTNIDSSVNTNTDCRVKKLKAELFLMVFCDSLPESEFKIHLIYPYDTSFHDNFECKGVEIEGDTIKAIIYIMKQLEIKSNALYAAEDILRYLTINGQVTNWKKFYKAVDKYKKVKDYQSVIQNK